MSTLRRLWAEARSLSLADWAYHLAVAALQLVALATVALGFAYVFARAVGWP